MPISTQHKVYLPASAKSNQYIMAEIKATPELYQHYGSEQLCYQQLSQQLFSLADSLNLHNVHLIATDKLPVVRFHTEAHVFQTAEQIIFFYNPQYHEAQNLFSKPGYQARKIQLLFLATGSDIRANAADFHQRVLQLLQQLQPQLPEQNLKIKIRDHQHLSYDLLAKNKGDRESYGYKLRAIAGRYATRKLNLPEHSALTYAHLTLPLSRTLKQQYVGNDSQDYSPLYLQLEQQLKSAIQAKELNRVAIIGNGLTPLVRNSKFDQPQTTSELQLLGFDPANNAAQFISDWQGDNLVEAVHILIVAGNDDMTETGYGRFMNQVEAALRSFADKLAVNPEKQDLTIRFHQHISYNG
ncbi:DUF3083 family protein [Arsukibacterium sp.]|uniref:DUF3083 family protein n=1 Tax=Arsukibacterium sp. TaxID=1977258 RepID=UPI00299E63DC|nr:DUF3083 family protein [Arsukibacterium sp.]MDX1537748.1 DUF3083 family protein [Arsukibacterium sp.]